MTPRLIHGTRRPKEVVLGLTSGLLCVAGICYDSQDIKCKLSIRVAQPFDGYFELRLTDAADTYTSVMALDDIEQLRSGQRNQAWRPAADRRARPTHRPRMQSLC